MKRILAVLLIAILLLPSVTAFAETPDSNSFSAESYYRTENPFTALPATFEATVKFPADTPADQEGGTILGNYQVKTVPGFAFKINNGGVPSLAICDNEKKYYSYDFNEVCVYTGDWVHLVLVKDSAAGTLSCYIDGALKQTLTAASPATVEMNLALGLGGDQRSLNSYYFRGSIKTAALYSEPITAAKIAENGTTPFNMEGMMAGYDLFAERENAIKDQSGHGFDMNMEYRFFKEKEAVEDYDYSFAVIGDPQYLTRNYEEKLYQMFEWVTENAEEKKMERTIILGDLTHRNSKGEWSSFQICVDDLPIPYTLVRGNHDGAQRFSDTFSFEDYGETVDGSFDGTMLNTYKRFKAGKVPYLILTLDYCPTDEVLEWANTVVAEHPKDNVIVATHNYLKGAGGLSSNVTEAVETDEENSESAVEEPTVGNGGTGIWEKLVKKHPNITMVLCGHTYEIDANIVEQVKGDHGNTVTQMRINAQRIDRVLGGVGVVTMFYFSENGTKLQVENYSTAEEAFFLKENQYTVELDLLDQGPSPLLWVAIGGGAVLLLAAVVLLFVLKKKKQA